MAAGVVVLVPWMLLVVMMVVVVCVFMRVPLPVCVLPRPRPPRRLQPAVARSPRAAWLLVLVLVVVGVRRCSCCTLLLPVHRQRRQHHAAARTLALLPCRLPLLPLLDSLQLLPDVGWQATRWRPAARRRLLRRAPRAPCHLLPLPAGAV